MSDSEQINGALSQGDQRSDEGSIVDVHSEDSPFSINCITINVDNNERLSELMNLPTMSLNIGAVNLSHVNNLEHTKLQSLTDIVTHAHTVSDIASVIHQLNAFDAVKRLLIDKISQLPYYYEQPDQDSRVRSSPRFNGHGQPLPSIGKQSISNPVVSTSPLQRVQIKFRDHIDEEEDDDSHHMDEHLKIHIDGTRHVMHSPTSPSPSPMMFRAHDDMLPMTISKAWNSNKSVNVGPESPRRAHSFSINNLYYKCTAIHDIFEADTLCAVITYLSHSSMYRKLAVLNKYFHHLMRRTESLYAQYKVVLPYTIHTHKYSKLYGKIMHEKNMIKIYRKDKYIKHNAVAMSVNALDFDVDDVRTIASDLQNMSDPAFLNFNDSTCAYDLNSRALEFEINDVQDLSDNIPLRIWSSIPVWQFLVSNLNANVNGSVNGSIYVQKQSNELLAAIMEKAAPSIRSIIVKRYQHYQLSANDMIHFANCETLQYLNTDSNDFIHRFLEYSNESKYILSQLVAIDLIHVDGDIVDVINNNLQRLSILRLQFHDVEKTQKAKPAVERRVITLPKTLQFIQVRGLDFNTSSYRLDFAQCRDLIAVVFTESKLTGHGCLDSLICQNVHSHLIWNSEHRIECVVIDENDAECNSCWYRYFRAVQNKQSLLNSSQKNLKHMPNVQYLRYVHAGKIEVPLTRPARRTHSEMDMASYCMQHLKDPHFPHPTRPITASPMLKYNNSLSIHDDENKHEHSQDLLSSPEDDDDDPDLDDSSSIQYPLRNASLTNIFDMTWKTHPPFTVLSGVNNDGLLWKLLLRSRYNRYKAPQQPQQPQVHGSTPQLQQEQEFYVRLVKQNRIQWIEHLGHKEPYFSLVNLSVENSIPGDFN